MSVHRAFRRGGLGQHALRSPRLAAALVEDAGVRPVELVLDLGAGSGRLTRALARRGARVWAVEVDPRPAASLRAADLAGVRVVVDDLLVAPLPQEPFRVVANPPFGYHDGAPPPPPRRPRRPLGRRRRRARVGRGLQPRRRLAEPPSERRLVEPLPALGRASPARRLLRAAAGRRRGRAPDHPARRAARARRDRLPRARRGRLLASRAAAAKPGGRVPPPALKRALRALGRPPNATARDLDLHAWAALFDAVRAGR